MRIIDAQVLGIKGFDTFTVQTTAGDFDTVSVILATGGRAVCTIDSGNCVSLRARVSATAQSVMRSFYRNREVAVIGNSDFALHEAEELRNVTPSVTIYTNGRGTGVFQRTSDCSQHHEDSGNRGWRYSFRAFGWNMMKLHFAVLPPHEVQNHCFQLPPHRGFCRKTHGRISR